MHHATKNATRAVVLVSMLVSACRADERATQNRDGAQPVAQGIAQVATIPLPGVEGRFDHFAADPKGGQLFVAALGNNSMEVIDLATNRRTLSRSGRKKRATASSSTCRMPAPRSRWWTGRKARLSRHGS